MVAPVVASEAAPASTTRARRRPMRRAMRDAVLALIVATTTFLGLSYSGSAVLRTLETESLDLRFRLRGVRPPGNEVAVVLVDDRSLETLGRWPLSRRLFAKAVELVDHAGARVIVFDLLFTEPDQPVSPELRDAARAVLEELSQ